jgi:hypothetical protein
MSVQKKSLIDNRAVAKKAAIAKTTEAERGGEAGSLKASALTAHSMKKKKSAVLAARTLKYR